MGKNTLVTCDECGKDITYTCNSIDWRVAVINQRIPAQTGPDGTAAVTDMMIYPAFDSDMYFCGRLCLIRKLCREEPGR